MQRSLFVMCRKTAVTIILIIVAVLYLIIKCSQYYVNRRRTMTENAHEKKMILNEQEVKLIQMIRETQYGELHIFVSDGRPHSSGRSKKKHKVMNEN